MVLTVLLDIVAPAVLLTAVVGSAGLQRIVGCSPATCSLCNESEAQCRGNQCDWDAAAGGTCQNPAVPCPCTDTALCRPLLPQPTTRREVVAFATGPATLDLTEWQTWPWEKITVLAPFECLGPAGGPRENECHEKGRVYHKGEPEYGVGQEMFCHAHAHGVRVLTWGYGSWNGTHCPIGEYYKWWTEKDDRVHNPQAVRDWAARSAACVSALGYDGILLDMETIGGPPLGPVSERSLITAAVCELKRELNASMPGALLAWTADTGGYFDFAELTAKGCVDLWLDMDYSRCSAVETHSSTRNRSPAPIDFTAEIVQNYKNKGVPPSHLGIVSTLRPTSCCTWIAALLRCGRS